MRVEYYRIEGMMEIESTLKDAKITAKEYIKDLEKVDENLNVLEELGQADTFLYTKTNFNNKIFVKNERDFDLIKSLPYYQNNVELVKEFPNE